MIVWLSSQHYCIFAFKFYQVSANQPLSSQFCSDNCLLFSISCCILSEYSFFSYSLSRSSFLMWYLCPWASCSRPATCCLSRLMMDWQSVFSWTACSVMGMKMFRFDFCSIWICSYSILTFILKLAYYLTWGSTGFKALELRNFFIRLILQSILLSASGFLFSYLELFIRLIQSFFLIFLEVQNGKCAVLDKILLIIKNQVKVQLFDGNLFLYLQMIYEIQQSSDSCPQCSRHAKRRSRSSSSSSESDQPHRIVIPLKKNVLQQNQNIEAALNLLHQEVEQLKEENKAKETQIRQLQGRLLDKVMRSQLNQPPQTLYEGERGGKKYRKYLSPDKSMRSQFLETGKDQYKRSGSSKTLNQVNYIEHKIQQINEYKNERIRILEDELQECQRACEELKARLDHELEGNEWMSQFCLSFCNMANQLSKMQGHLVSRQQWTLRQNTKNAWKFIKAFVKEVLE